MFRVEQSLPYPVTSVLRRGSAVTCLQGLRVRIPLGPVCLSLVSVKSAVRGLCVLLNTRSEEFY